jgi:hypothetical protein
MGARGYEFVNADRGEGYDAFAELDGSRRATTWEPVAVHRVVSDRGRRLRRSDFPWMMSHVLIMRQGAVDTLRDLLEANGELLPLSTDDDVELFAFNARVVDALDEAGSSLTMFPGTHRIMHIKKIGFVKSAVEGVDLFRVPHRATPTYVSERFVQRVNEAGLRGLDFIEAWSG